MHRFVCCMLLGVMLGVSTPSEQGAAQERRTPRRAARVVRDRQPAKLYEVRPRSPEPEAPAFLQPFPTYRTRSQFSSDEAYGKYVSAAITIGMRLKARVEYERVKKGMRGTYFGTNEGTPPCLVMWDDDLKSSSVLLDLFPRGKSSHAYWVYWHQVDLNLD
jgi:development and cellular proliferation protein Cullin-7